MALPAAQPPRPPRWLAQCLVLAALGSATLAGGCPGDRTHPPAGAPGKTAPKPPPVASAATPQPDPPTSSAALGFIGDFRSFTRPCGCTPHQPGGLVRLASMFDAARATLNGAAASKQLPAAQVALARAALTTGGTAEAPTLTERLWPIECGNFAWVGGRFPDLRLRTHLHELARLGVRAAIPGAGELQLKEADAAVLADSQVPLVSCNLTLKKPLFKLERYVELAPGWYVTGLSSWRPLGAAPPEQSWFTLAEPLSSLRAVIAELPPDSKLILVATYQPPEVYATLRELPLAALIGPGSWFVGESRDETGTTAVPAMPPASGEDALALPAELPAPPVKGVFLPLLRLVTTPDGKLRASSRFLEVNQAWPDDTAAQTLLSELNEAVVERQRVEQAKLNEAYGSRSGLGMDNQFLPEEQRQPDPTVLRTQLAQEPHYTGGGACAKCHPAAVATWQAGKHAHALETLVHEQAQNNLDCLQCHVTGLYEVGGYDMDNPTPELSAVGCENCHGPASHHLAAARLADLNARTWPESPAYWKGEKFSIRRSNLQDCTNCHDSYNSPQFQPDAYWGKIKH